MSLQKRFAAVGSITLISRIFGFVRDILMAASLGAGLAADAFVIAFKLPNFFRRLFAEGAFSAGFVPLYTERLEQEGKNAARLFAENILAWFLPILLVFLVAMEIGMVQVIEVLTGGFDGDATKMTFTVTLARITFPYLVLISLVALFAGVLNAHGRFSAAAFAPVLLNICMISALLWAPSDDKTVALYLSISVAIAGIIQMLWLLFVMVRNDLPIRPKLPRLSPDLKDLLRTIAPAALGAAIMQVNLLVDIFLAARFLKEGSVSWLFYADRLNQLTIGVVGVAISTVLLPTLAARFATGDKKGALEKLDTAIQFGLLIALPAAAALIVIAEPIISTLFERGAFTASYSAATSAALQAYALGLPAYVLIKCLTPVFFAQKDTKTPMIVGTLSMGINIVANLILIEPFGHVGLAYGTAISAIFQTLLLIILLHRQGLPVITRRLFRFLLGTGISVALMAGLLLMKDIWAWPPSGSSLGIALGGEAGRILNLTSLILGGGDSLLRHIIPFGGNQPQGP